MPTRAIENALAAYVQAVDDGRSADAAQFFTDDAIIEIPLSATRAQGRDACQALFDALRRPEIQSMHCLVNNLIRIDGETAEGSFDMFSIHYHLTPPLITGAIRCAARYAVENGAWKIAHLNFDVRVPRSSQ